MENSNNKHLQDLAKLAERLYKNSQESLKTGESTDETNKSISDFKKFLSQVGDLGDNKPNPFFWQAWPESTFYEIRIPHLINGDKPSPKNTLDFISAMKTAKNGKRKK